MTKILKYTPRYYEPNLDDVVYLNLNASETCNFRCKKCVQADSLVIAPHHHDPIDLIGLLTRAKAELNVRCLYLSGSGETFLVGEGKEHSKLANYRALMKHAHDLGIEVVQFTNGYFLTREMVGFLSDLDVSLVVSLDTLDPQKFAWLTGTSVNAFERVIGNINYARSLLLPTRSADRILYRFGINLAISHVNTDDIESMRDFCGEDIIFFTNYPIMRGGFLKNIGEMCLSVQR